MGYKEYKDKQEICFECRHTKRFHNSVHKGGCCSQPTCQCTCFIESGLYYGMDIFEAYEKGKEDGREIGYSQCEYDNTGERSMA